ncbi:hypothetical protein CsatB_028812 [Cannabis sativa]|uniref:bidirectional sugar transporter SWEET5-like n=1 Tax=Cannabis sativa TaxID=3483 RepID=UPI0029CA405E|nr:bidirectional sugar transporter SWEET5-like [Cannabis sativa]
MYAAPLDVMKLVITTKSVESMPFFLSFASLLNGSILVVTINGSGLKLVITTKSMEFMPFFLSFASLLNDKKKRIKVVLAELVFISILTLLTLTLTHSHKKRSTIVGTICILFNIMIYAVPLAVMKLVITTKSVEFMPFFLSFASLLNSIT